MNQTINVSLPKGLIDLAKRKVESGYYSSVSEVIRDALRKLESKPKYPVIELSDKANKMLEQAEADLQAGNVHTYNSFDELIEGIEDEDNPKQTSKKTISKVTSRAATL